MPRRIHNGRARLRRAFAASLPWASAAFAAPAFAQPAEGSGLPEVTITAPAPERDGAAGGYKARTGRQLGALGTVDLLDTPFSVHVVPQELIENLQASKPDDVLRLHPVVQVQGPQSRFFTSLTFRGFDVGSTRRVDGIPATTTYVDVPLEDKERIEVLTGLSGFLYGSGNVGGTVNYVLKRPVYQPLARVTFGNTEGANLRLHGDFGGRIDADGRFAYRLNVAAQDGHTTHGAQTIRRAFASGALDWNLADDLQLQFDLSRGVYHMRGTEPFWDADPGASYPSAPDLGRFYGQPFTRTDTTQNQLGVRLNWTPRPGVAVRAGLTRRDSSIDLTAANNIFTAGAPGRYRVQASAWDYPEVDTVGGFAFADAQFATGALRHKLTFGWWGDRDERTPFRSPAGGWATLTSAPMDITMPRSFAYTGGGPTGPKYRAQASRYDNWVIADQVALGDRWSVLAGLTHVTIVDTTYNAAGAVTARYDDSRLTPSLAVLFKPWPWATLYASTLQSLEKGGTAPLTANGVALVNAGEVMQPLLSRQVEVGAKAEAGGLLLTAALFEIDKGLQYTDARVPSAPRYVQDGRQVHRGLEFTATGRATPRLSLWGGLTLLDAKVRKQANNPALEGKTPVGVAEVLAKVYAEYDLPVLPGFTLTGGVLHQGRQQRNTLNTEQLPASTVLDAGLRFTTQVAARPVTWRLNVTNLTDRRYWMHPSYVGRPRTATLSAQVDL